MISSIYLYFIVLLDFIRSLLKLYFQPQVYKLLAVLALLCNVKFTIFLDGKNLQKLLAKKS